jgi:hypothetical protein
MFGTLVGGLKDVLAICVLLEISKAFEKTVSKIKSCKTVFYGSG